MKIFICLTVSLCVFFLGFYVREKMITKQGSVKTKEAIENIDTYKEKINTEYKYIYITNDITRESIIYKYNNLLADSKIAVENFYILKTEYDKLKRKDRDTYFLFGGFFTARIITITTGFRDQGIDTGVSVGIEHKKIGILLSYGVLQTSITVSCYYRF